MGFSPFASEETAKPHKWGSTKNKRFTDPGVNAWASEKRKGQTRSTLSGKA